jgi:hypothetical protein
VKHYDEGVCGPSQMFESENGDWCRVEDAEAIDEEFAQFVFEHFGGWWLRGSHPTDRERMRALPERIATRVTAIAREYELKRGGP